MYLCNFVLVDGENGKYIICRIKQLLLKTVQRGTYTDC